MRRILALVLVVMGSQVGCASRTGWRFEIGVSPVKSLDNRAGLEQGKEEDEEEKRNGKY